MSDELSGSVAEVESPESSSPPPDVSPNATSAPQEAAPVASAPTQESPYSAFRQLPQFANLDDRAIASSLYQSMQREEAATRALRQYQSLVPVATEYMNNRDAFESWKQSRLQPQAPSQAAEQPPGWWNPPKIRDSYKQYLVKDDNGREIIHPDAPPEVRHSLVEYQQYKADFAKKFLENPEQALGPMVEKVASERAATIMQEQLGRYQATQYVSNLEEENRDWLFDQNGNVSAEGRAAQEYIEQAKALGIQGPKQRWDFAVKMVERDLLHRYHQQARVAPQAVAPQAAPMPAPPQVAPSVAEKNMEFLRQQASRKPSQTTPETTDPRVPKPAKTFAQRLAQAANESRLIDPS